MRSGSSNFGQRCWLIIAQDCGRITTTSTRTPTGLTCSSVLHLDIPTLYDAPCAAAIPIPSLSSLAPSIPSCDRRLSSVGPPLVTTFGRRLRGYRDFFHHQQQLWRTILQSGVWSAILASSNRPVRSAWPLRVNPQIQCASAFLPSAPDPLAAFVRNTNHHGIGLQSPRSAPCVLDEYRFCLFQCTDARLARLPWTTPKTPWFPAPLNPTMALTFQRSRALR